MNMEIRSASDTRLQKGKRRTRILELDSIGHGAGHDTAPGIVGYFEWMAQHDAMLFKVFPAAWCSCRHSVTAREHRGL
jgi:hypothetical protein